ncbi:NADAR family protein [Paraflavitalea soli]|uniref:NADAR family protein n=1 Tax=Paraflavitalea soli TaxID=2315862 RepID=A0A3B7N398_9BACT|nr:NADAR family protein [Paraflavitalea soli]AXY76711.1 NADAR family protein [Paraflavitalea soli]
MKYSLDILIKQVEAGEPVEYFFFWGHTQKQQGIIDKSCLSQWYPAAFTVDGITYPTAEHWMMAKKALLFGDDEAFQEVLSAPKPAVAKAIGRKVRNFDAGIWQEKGYLLVAEGSFHKFSQHADLQQFLLRTGKKVIVEASPFDKIWGIGMAQSAKGTENPLQWKGANLLGFALMEARDRLLLK